VLAWSVDVKGGKDISKIEKICELERENGVLFEALWTATTHPDFQASEHPEIMKTLVEVSQNHLASMNRQESTPLRVETHFHKLDTTNHQKSIAQLDGSETQTSGSASSEGQPRKTSINYILNSSEGA